MKKYFLFFLLSFSICKFSSAQILCIYCYDQNAPISTGVNNLVVNGGFENNNCFAGSSGTFCPNSNYYSCDIANWLCTGGGINTYANIYEAGISTVAIPEGTHAAYFGNFFCNACSPATGDTLCIVNTGCTVSGIPTGYPINNVPGFGGPTGVSLEQTVNGLVSGNTYVLEFWAGGEYIQGFLWASGLFAVDVGFGDTLLRDKTTPLGFGTGTRFIIEFNATSSSHTIKFTNWGHICDSCTELELDDVRLYTLAELDPSVPHCTVGLDFPNLENLENLVSPNPVTNELNVKTNSNDLSEIILYDIFSKKLLQQTFINSVPINTSQFSKGIYFYEIRNKEGVVKKGKVVKE